MRTAAFGMLGLLLGLACATPSAAAGWPRQITDIAGREVAIDRPPERILLTEGFQLLWLAVLERDPVARLAAWGGDLKRFDVRTYERFRARFPGLADVPVVGSGTGESFSIEGSLAAAPDLAFVASWQVPGGADDPLLRHLTAAGIPVLVVDYYQQPSRHTVASLDVMARAMGREAEADAFARFYTERMNRLAERMQEPPPWRPRVLIHAYPGLWPCCWSAGSEGIGRYIDLFGGINIGAGQYPTANGGMLNLEFVIAQDPQVYIVTGLAGADRPGALEIGTDVPLAAARASLGPLLRAPGVAELDAVRAGRTHGIWNFMVGTPLGIAGLEALASWIQPALFADLDPVATQHEINERFLAVPLEGTYWVSEARAKRAGGGEDP